MFTFQYIGDFIFYILGLFRLLNAFLKLVIVPTLCCRWLSMISIEVNISKRSTVMFVMLHHGPFQMGSW